MPDVDVVVVGADDAESAVAELTGTETRTRPHDRFGFAGDFAGIPRTPRAVTPSVLGRIARHRLRPHPFPTGTPR